MEYSKSGIHHVLSLTHRDLESSQILYQWNLVALYESISWLTDVVKIKATKVVPNERISKVNFNIFFKQFSLQQCLEYTTETVIIELVLSRGRKTYAMAMGNFEQRAEQSVSY